MSSPSFWRNRADDSPENVPSLQSQVPSEANATIVERGDIRSAPFAIVSLIKLIYSLESATSRGFLVVSEVNVTTAGKLDIR
jgi:hypothetical protein